MKNREIAGLLFNVSTILADQGGNSYRVRAYRRAAQNLLRLRHEVADRAQAGEPLGVPFLGKRLTKKITQLALDSGTEFYDEICGLLPPAQAALVHVPGIGPRLAERITSNLHTEQPAELVKLAATLGLQHVPGIGPKRAALIMNHIVTEQTSQPTTVQLGNVVYVQESFWNPERKAA